MLKIGDFSRLSGVSIRMLRYYDQQELLQPAYTDTTSGYRYYIPAQLSRVNQLQKLKEMGFSLVLAKEVLSYQDNLDELEALFVLQEQEIQVALDKVIRQSFLLKQAREFLRSEQELPNYNVVLKQIPYRPVIYLRETVSGFSDEGKLWQSLAMLLKNHAIKPASLPYAMAIYHDQEYKEEHVDIEVQLPIDNMESMLTVPYIKMAPAMTVASVTFNGPYEQMTKVCQAIAHWLENSHYQINGVMFNIYHVSPAQTLHTEEWITEACYQIIPVES